MCVCVSIPGLPHRQEQAILALECRDGLKMGLAVRERWSEREKEGGQRGRERKKRAENNEGGEQRTK